jgi:hypothetical protein
MPHGPPPQATPRHSSPRQRYPTPTHPAPLQAGLSTYLPLRNEEGIISPANAGTPILQAHGDADMVVSRRGAGTGAA